jgi:PAS domain-containing protein
MVEKPQPVFARGQLETIASQASPEPVSMISTAELARRPSRPSDYAAENHALVALMRELATTPDTILKALSNTALTLCCAHSAGFSLLEDGDQKNNFYWHAIAGQWAPHVGRGTPRDFGPCGTVLDRKTAMLCSHPERDFPYLWEVSPLLNEGLLLPFYVDGEAIGTIWVISHDESRRFDAEDLRVMTNLATFAETAYKVRLSRNKSIEANQRLRESEARLKASVDLLKLGLYAWNPQTNELQWDETLRAMWGLPHDTPVDYAVWRAGVHRSIWHVLRRPSSAAPIHTVTVCTILSTG